MSQTSTAPPDMTADPMISPKPVMTVETEVSSFDQTSAMLTAWVIVLGTLVGALLMIWLSTVVKDRMIVTTSIPLEEIPIGDGPPPLGIGDDWHPPGVEDFPEVDIPQLATAIEAMTALPSLVASRLEKFDGTDALMGKGTGLGDRRGVRGGTGRGGVSPAARWQVRYSASTITEYIGQLEYFGVELGAVSETTNNVKVISDLSAPQPATRNTTRGDEKRVYFAFGETFMRRWDTELVRRAGIVPDDRLIVQFYPVPVQQQLGALERAAYEADGRTEADVERTHFGVRESGDGYEFFVSRIDYK
jgi:hypothetical protein